ncbi:hypothetical protein V8E53_009963 [Lactarius tabidus]
MTSFASSQCSYFPAAPPLPISPQNAVRMPQFSPHAQWYSRRLSPSQTNFFSELSMKPEVVIMFLIKIVAGEVEATQARPGWTKVLAMEIMRGLAYAHTRAASAVMPNDTVPHSSSHSLDSVVGMVTTAASATVSNVIGMFSTDAGLGAQIAACIDRQDKADAPPIPDADIYFLGVRCLVLLSDSLAGYATPFVLQRLFHPKTSRRHHRSRS